MSARRILVAGAGGAVGFEIVRALRARNCAVVATYRTARDGLDDRLHCLGAKPAQWDLADLERGRDLLGAVDSAVFTPILTVAEGAAALAPEKQLVFFSSNNIAIDPGAPVYAALNAAEIRVRETSASATILRPTMIYGYPGDGNLSVLLRAIQRSPVTPRIGNGRALQQPIFFRDVASIVAEIVVADKTTAQTVATAGPSPMSQDALYRAVCAAAGGKSAIVPAPAWLASAAARLADVIGLRFPLSPAQIARADLDKIPVNDGVILGETLLAEGLAQLAAALDDTSAGA